MKIKDEGVDYDTPALQRQSSQEDREKDETMSSLHEAESEVKHAIETAPPVESKKD